MLRRKRRRSIGIRGLGVLFEIGLYELFFFRICILIIRLRLRRKLYKYLREK